MAINEFSQLIQDVVTNDPSQVKSLAHRVGKKYPLFLREINPYDMRAKLGAETLLRIMEESGDMRPLEYMARQFGLELQKAAVSPAS